MGFQKDQDLQHSQKVNDVVGVYSFAGGDSTTPQS